MDGGTVSQKTTRCSRCGCNVIVSHKMFFSDIYITRAFAGYVFECYECENVWFEPFLEVGNQLMVLTNIGYWIAKDKILPSIETFVDAIVSERQLINLVFGPKKLENDNGVS